MSRRKKQKRRQVLYKQILGAVVLGVLAVAVSVLSEPLTNLVSINSWVGIALIGVGLLALFIVTGIITTYLEERDGEDERESEVIPTIYATPASTVTPSRSQHKPLLTASYISREDEVSQLVQLVQRPSTTQGQMMLTAVQGNGGVGKSMLVAAALQDEALIDAYPDGAHWINIGRNPGNLIDQFTALGIMLGDSPAYYSGPQSAWTRLDTLLADKQMLLILDDVWSKEHVESFGFAASGCHVLFTTRSKQLAQALDAAALHLGLLSLDQSVELLARVTRKTDPNHAEIARVLGNLPLALDLTGKRLASGMDSAEWLQRFRENLVRDNALQACFDLSLQSFPELVQTLFYSLGIFPSERALSLAIIEPYWQKINPQLTANDVREYLHRFSQLSLLEFDEDVRIHSLLHDYNRHRLGASATKRHGQFLEVYGIPEQAWHKSQLDSYLSEYLAHHMIGAQQSAEMVEQFKQAIPWSERHYHQPDPIFERTVATVWQQMWRDDPESAKQFLTRKWLSRRLPRNYDEGYTTRFLAVQCAREVGCNAGVVAALAQKEVVIRSNALSYIYYLSQSPNERGQALEIMQALGDNIVNAPLFPRLHVMRAFFLLLPIMLMDQYQRHDQDTAHINEITRVVRNVMGRLRKKPLVRMLGPISQMWLVRVGITVFTLVLRNATATSVNGLAGYRRYFDQPQSLRTLTSHLVQYADGKQQTDLPETLFDDVLQLFEAPDRITTLVGEFILIAHGVENPDSVIPTLQRLVALPDRGRIHVLAATHILYSILDRQEAESIRTEHIELLEQWITGWLDDSKPQYGSVEYMANKIQYLPLAYYAAIWTKRYPGKPVNLLEKLANQAQHSGNQPLWQHVIRTFQDFRQPLYDYPTALRVLDPAVEVVQNAGSTSDSAEIRKMRQTLTETLGTLRSIETDHVEAYMEARSLALALVTDVRRISFQKRADELYVRLYWLLSDIVVYAPRPFVRQVLGTIKRMLEAGSLGRLASILIHDLLRLVDDWDA